MTNVIDFIERHTDKTISRELMGVLWKNDICLDEVREFFWKEGCFECHVSNKEMVTVLFNYGLDETYAWEEIERLLRSQSAKFYLSRMGRNTRLLKYDLVNWDGIEDLFSDIEEAA
jgi:hypothetical protein